MAFQKLKRYLSHPPIMSSPVVDEVLFAYIAVALYAISFVLIRVDSGIQQPIYYVSKSLNEAEMRYLPLEKAILAVVHATRKLPHYFQAHTMVVLTQLPLKSNMQKEAQKYVKKCVQCQRFAPNIHQPGGVLNPLSSPWPFAQWGLDIVGPFPKAVGNKKYLLVCTNYFINWVEVEPLANIRDVGVKRFIWKNIVTRFGVPNVLISDNGFQFDSKAFRKYCFDLGIKNRYSTPAYLQGNGQAEVVNKVIMNGLKKRLDDAKGRWVEKLPHVLWTYRTTPQKSTRETPFLMTYGAEAVIPLENGFPTIRSSAFTSDGNNEPLKKNLDLIEERRENAIVQLAYYQHKLKQVYDMNVKLRPLAPGDLVLRKVVRNTKNPAWGKLGPNWEGPYRITSVARVDAYCLEI